MFLKRETPTVVQSLSCRQSKSAVVGTKSSTEDPASDATVASAPVAPAPPASLPLVACVPPPEDDAPPPEDPEPVPCVDATLESSPVEVDPPLDPPLDPPAVSPPVEELPPEPPLDAHATEPQATTHPRDRRTQFIASLLRSAVG